MSSIKINIRNVICASEDIQAARKEAVSVKKGIRGTVRFIDPRIRSRDNLDNRLNQICDHISQIENQMNRIQDVVSNGANKYRTIESQAVLKARELSGVNVQTKKAGRIKKNRELFHMAAFGAVDIAGVSAFGFKHTAQSQKAINRWMDKIPKTYRNILKASYKKLSKGTLLEGGESAYKIWSKIAEGKYLDALGEFVNETGGKMYKSGARIENTMFNWKAVKVRAAVSTIKVVLDDDGYIAKNRAKYEEMVVASLRRGDIAGCVGAITGELVQTVGKGTVDVLCQTTGAFFDSTISLATGGMMSLSSINDLMYDASGTDPKEMLNSITDGISRGVDFVVDKGLIQGGLKISEAVGSAFSASVHFIGSIF